jgi:hypothetical protein
MGKKTSTLSIDFKTLDEEISKACKASKQPAKNIEQIIRRAIEDGLES